MTFRQFAFNQVMRNKRLYMAYFLSSLFTVMVFFTFAIFAFHPAFRDGAVHRYVLFGMSVAGGIIYVFSFFFVLYSMSSFLHSRKREFGLLTVLGASSSQIRRLVFLENILIGFLATVGGIVTGLIFAKAILLIAENVLIIEESLDFYFPTLAIIVTFVSFMILFFCISLFVSFVLRTNKLIHLIKSDKLSKGEPKSSLWLAVLAAFLLLAGYGTALYVKGIQVVHAMVPVIVIVIIGTYLLFTQLSVYIIRRLKSNKNIFWRKTNMLLFSDLSFRMKDNARTFFLVAIISTVAFSAIGSLFGFHSYLTKGVKEANPYSFIYTPLQRTGEKEILEEIKQVDAILQEEHVSAKKETAVFHYFEMAGRHGGVLIAKASDYNRFAALLHKDPVFPKEDEAIIVEQSHVMMYQGKKASEILLENPLRLENGQVLRFNRIIESEVLPEVNGYYIVNDEIFDQLGTPLRSEINAVWQAAGGQKEQVIEAGRKLTEQLPIKTFSIDYALYEINKAYGPILFIGLFIGIVFFVSAGSFLYFRLFTDLDADKEKFRSVAKIGLAFSELKKVVNRQTALLFFAPIAVALVHGAVALTALSRMFDYDLTAESAFVLGSFAVIQIIYFLIVRFFYLKQLKKAVAV